MGVTNLQELTTRIPYFRYFLRRLTFGMKDVFLLRFIEAKARADGVLMDIGNICTGMTDRFEGQQDSSAFKNASNY
jgi:hypothetical protein